MYDREVDEVEAGTSSEVIELEKSRVLDTLEASSDGKADDVNDRLAKSDSDSDVNDMVEELRSVGARENVEGVAVEVVELNPADSRVSARFKNNFINAEPIEDILEGVL